MELVTDNESSYVSVVINNLCKYFNIDKVKIMPYRPQSNSPVERLNRSILEVMRQMIIKQDQWDIHLLAIQEAINNRVHNSTGYSPNFLMTGREKRLPYSLLEGNKPMYIDDYAELLVKITRSSWQDCEKELKKKQQEYKKSQHKRAKDKPLKIGDCVYREIEQTEIKPKLSKPFSGPYTVEKIKGNKAILRDVDNQHNVIELHKDRIKPTPGHL